MSDWGNAFRKLIVVAGLALLACAGATQAVLAQSADAEFRERLSDATGDAALEIAQEVFDTLLYQNPAGARELMLIANAQAEGRTDHDLHSNILRGIAVSYAIQSNLEMAEKYYLLGLQEAEAGQGTWLARLILNIGILEHQKERFGAALARFREALDLSEADPNPRVEALAHYYIGIQMDALGLSENAEAQLREAISKEQQLEGFRTLSAFELARIVSQKGAIAEAERLMERGRVEILAASPSQYSAAVGYVNSAEIELAKSDYDAALASALQAQDIFVEVDAQDRGAQAACVAAQAALNLTRFEQAVALGQTCLTLSDAVQYQRQRAEGATVLSLASERLGLIDQALEYSRIAAAAREQFLEQQNAQETEIALAGIQEAFNQQAVETAKRNEADAVAQANRTRTFFAASLFGTLLLIGLLIALVTVLKQRKHANDELAQMVREREILLAELNHRVKNNLQVVASLLGLERRRVDPSSENASSMQDIQARVLSMVSIHENLQSSDSMEVVPVKQYLEKLAERLAGLYQSDCVVEVDVDENRAISIDTLGPVGLILCELVSNAFEHAYEGEEDGEIIFSFDEDGDSYVLGVRDKGVGLPTEFDLHNTHSLGLNLVKDLAQQIDAKFDFQRGDRGTLWRVLLPSAAVV